MNKDKNEEDMEYVIYSIVAILSLAAVAIVTVVGACRDYRYGKKIEFLKHLVDKDYETENIDINNL